jgi:predicted RNA-binding Zn-ribbon protein involved in translation (DUF1610 family)
MKCPMCGEEISTLNSYDPYESTGYCSECDVKLKLTRTSPYRLGVIRNCSNGGQLIYRSSTSMTEQLTVS